MQPRRFLTILVLLLSRFCSSEAASIPESGHVYPRSENDNQTDQIPAWVTLCVYPISGSYTQFQRVLFYIVVIVVFLFRFHKWVLVTGAAWLAGCIVPAAIHCVAMSFESNIGLDADLIPSSTILRTGFMATIIFALYPSDVYKNSTPLLWIGTWLLLICDNLFVISQLVGRYHAMMVLSTTNCSDASLFECSSACYRTQAPTLFRAPDDKMTPLAWYGPSMIDDPGPLGNSTSGGGVNQGGQGTGTDGNSFEVFSIEDNEAGMANQTALVIVFWILLSIFMMTASLGVHCPPRVSRNWVMRRISNGFPRDGNTNWLKHNLKMILTVVVYIWRVSYFIAFPLLIVNIFVQFLLASMSVSKCRSRSWVLLTPFQLQRQPTPLRVRVAKIIALAWYFWAMVGYMGYLGGVIFIVWALEMQVSYLPESEGLVAIGQWGPWAGISLVVLVAIYERLTQSKKRNDAADYILLSQFAARDAQKLPNTPLSGNLPCWILLKFVPRRLRKHPQIASCLKTIILEWQDFRTWWNDPITSAWNDGWARECDCEV